MGQIQLPALGDLLAYIEAHDTDYEVRHGAVLLAVAVAKHLGHPGGFRIDDDEPAWPIAYIELPTGQVSWHVPEYSRAWDGHSDTEKYERCRAYTAQGER